MCGVCYLLSLMLIFGTWFKPKYFWLSSQALNVRTKFGERGAEAFYYVIGGSMLALGIIAATS